MSQHFDAIIIGTGQAGPSLAARFSAAGMAVAIIERHKFGGTCVNTGCFPTKTMVASAYAAHVARRGAEFGFDVKGDVRLDMKRVKARKDEISGRSSRGVEEWLRGLKNCTVIRGHAHPSDGGGISPHRLVPTGTLCVGGGIQRPTRGAEIPASSNLNRAKS